MSEKFLTGTEKNSEETKKNHVDSTVDVIDRIGSHLENILMKTFSNVPVSRTPVKLDTSMCIWREREREREREHWRNYLSDTVYRYMY